MSSGSKVLLIILDGFGEGKPYPGNAVTLARTPTLTKLREKYPWTLLKASGEAVGIPEGTQGGSEVGHFTIGAGRIVFQQLEEINRAIQNGDFFKKPALLEACERVKSEGVGLVGSQSDAEAALHLVGMISDQGVHAHINHLFALLELAKREKVAPVFIHAITDGRDVHEKSAEGFIKQIEKKIRELDMQDRAKIATIVGRYYAMDRDSNWKRLQPAYDLYTLGEGRPETSAEAAVQHAYERGIETDYYIDPIVLDPHAVIKEKDAVIFWNFRGDRARELTWAFTGEHDPKNGRPVGIEKEKDVRPFFVCFGPYSEVAPVVFPTAVVKNNVGEVISKAGLRQLRLAETQKYAHVTYFMNSQIEEPFPGEDRIMIESKRCTSYAQVPEMSALEVTETLIQKLNAETYDAIFVNFANLDLVGHSGDLAATIKAVEIIDECLGRIIPEAQKNGYATIITGDHGNAEYKIYEDTGEPCPSHTTNPVPCIIVGSKGSEQKTANVKRKRDGELKDIAPTILKIMNVKQPAEMTGNALL